MELTELFETENISLEFSANNKDEAIKKLSELICKNRDFINPAKVYEILMEREELGSTGIGNEVAIPHGKIDFNHKIVGAIALSRQGVEFEAIDKKPVKIFFALLTGSDSTNLHLKVLAKISRLLMDGNFRNAILNVKSKDELKTLLKNR